MDDKKEKIDKNLQLDARYQTLVNWITDYISKNGQVDFSFEEIYRSIPENYKPLINPSSEGLDLGFLINQMRKEKKISYTYGGKYGLPKKTRPFEKPSKIEEESSSII